MVGRYSMYLQAYSAALPFVATTLTYLIAFDCSVSGQLADTPTRGLVNSLTGHLAYRTSRGLDISRMPPATLRA